MLGPLLPELGGLLLQNVIPQISFVQWIPSGNSGPEKKYEYGHKILEQNKTLFINLFAQPPRLPRQASRLDISLGIMPTFFAVGLWFKVISNYWGILGASRGIFTGDEKKYPTKKMAKISEGSQ